MLPIAIIVSLNFTPHKAIIPIVPIVPFVPRIPLMSQMPTKNSWCTDQANVNLKIVEAENKQAQIITIWHNEMLQI